MPYHAHKYWLAVGESEFVLLCALWKTELQNVLRNDEQMALFKWNKDDVDEVLAGIQAFLEARARYLAANSTPNRIAKDAAKKTAKDLLRAFANSSVRYNRNIKDEYKVFLGLPIRGTTHTALGPPATRAVLSGLKALGGFQLELRFYDEANPGRAAVPYGCSGCLLSYALSDKPITDYADLTQTKLMTRTPFPLSLTPADAHKHISCALRWQSERGKLGPWSDIAHAVVL